MKSEGVSTSAIQAVPFLVVGNGIAGGASFIAFDQGAYLIAAVAGALFVAGIGALVVMYRAERRRWA